MSCIYKITVGEKEYIGSTDDYEKRMKKHKSDCFNPNVPQYNYKIYHAIRENDGVYKTEIIYMLQEGEDNFIVEQKYQDLLSPELCMMRAYNSPEYTKKYQTQYNFVRKAQQKEYDARPERKAKRLQYGRENKEYYAQYRLDNKENSKAYYTQYRLDNKEELRVKAGTKVTCECGRVTNRANLSTHRKSKIHQDLISQKIII